MPDYNYEPDFDANDLHSAVHETGDSLWDFLDEFSEVTYESDGVYGWRDGHAVRLSFEAPARRIIMHHTHPSVADLANYNPTPSAHYTVGPDFITDNISGETMATTIRTTEDLSTLTDEQLAEQERAFKAEADRRAEEQARRIREAKPSFTKFVFEAQYPISQYDNEPGLSRYAISSAKKYKFVGQVLDDGRVYITGQVSPNIPLTFASWSDFETYARDRYRWMSGVRRLVADINTPVFEVKRKA